MRRDPRVRRRRRGFLLFARPIRRSSACRWTCSPPKDSRCAAHPRSMSARSNSTPSASAIAANTRDSSPPLTWSSPESRTLSSAGRRAARDRARVARRVRARHVRRRSATGRPPRGRRRVLRHRAGKVITVISGHRRRGDSPTTIYPRRSRRARSVGPAAPGPPRDVASRTSRVPARNPERGRPRSKIRGPARRGAGDRGHRGGDAPEGPRERSPTGRPCLPADEVDVLAAACSVPGRVRRRHRRRTAFRSPESVVRVS